MNSNKDEIASSKQSKQNQDALDLIQVLTTAIPGFDSISNLARNKIKKAFKERIFMPRVKLIEEGKSSNYAYIIKKGTCMLVSSKNPLLSKISHKGHIIVEK